VREDAPANAVDRSGSPPMTVPLGDFSWVDPRVMEMSSTYGTEESVAKFLRRQPVLKAEEYSSHFCILPCGVDERVCMGRPGSGPPFFYMYTCFFVDFLFPFLLMSLRWASFGRSTLLPPRFTQIPGHPFKPSVCCVTLCVFTPRPHVFFLTITPILPKRLPGIRWSAGLVVFFFIFLPFLTSVLKRDL